MLDIKMLLSKLIKVKLLFTIIFLLLLWIPFYFIIKPLTESALSRDEARRMVIPKISQETVNGRLLTISVFYESLCPDSSSFFENELLPSFRKIPHLLNVDLIPYGKATTQEISPTTYKFSCQHGELECLGNMFHACAIDIIKDPWQQVKMTTCMIVNNVQPREIAKTCSQIHNAPFNDISDCVDKRGPRLLHRNGLRTHSLSPPMSFVPTILLDGNRDNQALILKNLWKEICITLSKKSQAPKECDTKFNQLTG